MKKCGSTGTGDPIPREKKGGSGDEDEDERPAGVPGMVTRIGSVRFEDD